MTSTEYYNTYIYNLLMDCYIEIETARGRGNEVEHKKYPRPEPPKFVQPIVYMDFIEKMFKKDQRKWFFPRSFYSLLHCELFFAKNSYTLTDQYINPEYIKLLNSYETSYKELLQQEKERNRIKEDDEDDYEEEEEEDEVERTNKKLKEYIKDAKQDIQAIKKNGYYEPYTSGYKKYASSMHSYLVEIRDDLFYHKFQLWLKLDYWVVGDLKNIISQYENIYDSYPDNYAERIIKW